MVRAVDACGDSARQLHGEHDGNRFVFWEYTQDDASEYAYVIEVKNSSTGVLLSANSRQDAEDVFGRLTISLAGK
ncbi:hypothetical protein BAAM0483_08820 [Bifidobacterium animalis subsp. animalis MCC 0483]|uniref:DUF1508 domain-containing protein n=1 Tax=Bifidobacterium animalis subsp. animalis MCC 0483 TaxID=1365955 RepID=A0AB34T644_9BIFI|nr:hypothetical protein [Bifidobacterium animalis]ARE60187.1 hypothetical protein A4U98_08020 [Bifidobacterium animalis subsp. animalis]KOA48260.1 hypothetical protein BAAM0483_08820 [Bifidobacterium animalis subsp. animalis MCC 0483]KOA58821.1 hypothetical protein BAAM0499_08080 [Bifidobacterium animalis subsp. animalis MCC 0499]PHQ53602.1 hypothetical protein ADH71_005020 [Bifidobacterium animalis subsp. animalis]QQQ90648.1 hypothetical protein I5Q88_02120 [Bifidobacterium animalis]